MASQLDRQSSSIVAIGGFLTVVWMIIAFVGLSYSQRCSNQQTDNDWTATYLACLKPDQIGILAAGLFAPLACIWFFIALLMQHAVLTAMRKELWLTRQAKENTLEEQRLANLYARENLHIQYRLQAMEYWVRLYESILSLEAWTPSYTASDLHNKLLPIRTRAHMLGDTKVIQWSDQMVSTYELAMDARKRKYELEAAPWSGASADQQNRKTEIAHLADVFSNASKRFHEIRTERIASHIAETYLTFPEDEG